LDAVSVDQQIQLAADLTNGQDREQPFTFIVEFKNEDGARIYFAGDNPRWITGSLSSGQSFSPALSWIPTRSGTYIAELSVTETVDDFIMNNTKLAPSLITQIVVGDVDVVKSITIQTDSTSYVEGSEITISGSITNYNHNDPSEQGLVSLFIFSPNGNIVTVHQVMPDSDGNYSATANTLEWDSAGGEYEIRAGYRDVNVVKSITIQTEEPEPPRIDSTLHRSIGAVEESWASPACVEAGCYTPSNLSANVGDTIFMTNTDPTGVHTFTSGTVDGFAPSPSGIFDTGVLMSGDSFAWTPTEAGTVPYYCMLHTWMTGTITVN
jgi:plastocyanin